MVLSDPLLEEGNEGVDGTLFKDSIVARMSERGMISSFSSSSVETMFVDFPFVIGSREGPGVEGIKGGDGDDSMEMTGV